MLNYLRLTFERLITPETLAGIYHDSVFLILGIAVICAFRKPITRLLGRLRSHESKFLGKNLLESPYDSVHTRQPSPEGESCPLPDKIDRGKAAHFYWLGSDLMDLFRNLEVAPDKESAQVFLAQILHHFQKSGMKSNEIERQLEWVIRKSLEKPESKWNDLNSRRELANEILSIRRRISRFVVNSAGTGFVPWAEKN